MISNEEMNKEIKKTFSNVDRECVVDQELYYNNINVGDFVLNGKLRYRSFRDGYSNIYTLDNGCEILSITRHAPLPAYVFDSVISCLDRSSGGIVLHFYLKPEYMHLKDSTIVEDALETKNIAGFDLLFDKSDFEVFEEMECIVSFSPKDENKIYEKYEDFENEIKEKLNKLRFDFNEKLTEEYYQEQEFEGREDFLNFVNNLSVEDLNKFLREEAEIED